MNREQMFPEIMDRFSRLPYIQNEKTDDRPDIAYALSRIIAF